MDYDFLAIEQKWQQYWDTHKTFEAANKSTKPKYYVLDMFPYPSGAGLHVGHPLGYIASDIVSRYRRHKGFNVLHPMGFDAFGLPAEQYAIQTGKHPKETTRENITRYVSQMKRIGFAYDWDRTVTTSNPSYYKWTQWIFLKLFGSWYDNAAQKARPIEELARHFAASGTQNLDAFTEEVIDFTATSWNSWSKTTQSEVLMKYRLAYQGDAWVNWCEALGTVLANDEVKDGVSERGGHPVERKKMRNWFLRITAYAERLLADLDTLEWSEAMKEMQRNWIGKSEGAAVRFSLQQPLVENSFLEVFTTRPDTIFGVSFMVLAPEHEWVGKITTAEQKVAVEKYVAEAKNRSERERQADVKRVTGVFTGAYAIHPFTGNPIPIWIGEYVLAGYGTGAVMAVPGHDSRDFAFAKHFGLPVPRVITGSDGATGELEEAYEAKDGTLINSGFLDGLPVKKAIQKAIEAIEAKEIGTREINFRLRDANFSRQRYWGEPFPILFKDGIPEAVAIEDLPVVLPDMEDFKPTGKPESPLVKAENWVNLPDGSIRETDTMPGFAGSSWYFLRYMDAGNPAEFASKEALNYWKDVDLYIGGTEHAVGHLLYARFWHKLLFDYGYVPTAEPFRKLVNQGMILGRSNFVYRVKNTNTFVSEGLKDQYEVTALHVDVNIVNHDILDLDKFRKALPEYKDAEFILETATVAEGKEETAGEGIYRCGSEIEKMSKSKLNVVNPDDICDTYGADTLRLYEMFLGPIDQHKPWNIQGIEGVHKFLKKLWRTCIDREGNIALTPGEPSKEELKALHKTIKKITEDIENLSLNTCVSAFMILLNELTDLKSANLSIYKAMFALLSPFAPHLAEELWERTGEKPGTLCEQPFPVFNPEFLVENNFDYPVSFNGKMRFKIHLPLNLEPAEIEAAVKQDPQYERWLEGKTPKKVIVVKGKIINIVI